MLGKYVIDSDSDVSDGDHDRSGGVASEVRCTNNITTLLTAFSLFMGVCIAQSVGAVYANSLALLGDAASMGVDSLSFLGNLYAECGNHDARRQERDRLISSAASVLVLLTVTMVVVVDAINRLMHPVETDARDVNPEIVLGFALLGLSFDIISGVVYCRNKRTSMEDDDAADINMTSAMLHVASDSLRSVVTLLESLLIMLGHANPGQTDTWSALIVSGIIITGCIATLFSWRKSYHAYTIRHGFELLSTTEIELT